MLTINTNLSSLIAQNSLNKSTNALNLAIERMSTGFKINHSKDNAANYAIVNDMNSQISSLDVAEDNVSQGLDLITTADQMLGEINDRVSRLRDLQVQASNGTYGKESLEAINAEVNALVDEVQRLYQNAEYNGIKLFMETEEDENGEHYYEQETFADESTTFEQLGLTATSFSVYDKDDNLIQTYDVEESDTLGDFLTTLTLEGFTARMDSGTVQIKSDDGKYIKGDLADSLGISTKETNYIQSTEQNFDNEIPVTTESTTVITETTTVTEKQTTTDTIPVTITVETTTIKTTETVVTTYTATTDTLVVPATAAATFAMRSGATPAAETGGFIEPITRRDTSTMTALSSMASNATLASGTYKISTTAELQQLATMTNAGYIGSDCEFVLADNIDLSSISNWTRIGTSSLKPFRGIFDGNGYVISNLTIDNESVYQGLFGHAYTGSEIKNIGLENVNVKGNESVGGLVGHADGDITNCYVSGDVSGTGSNVGGLVGRAYGDITNCHVSVTVTGTDYYVGGLAGYANSDITNCHVSVTVTGTDYYVGGLVGGARGDITNCYVSGSVSGADYVGGLVGLAPMGAKLNITSCNVDTTITGTSNLGGFVGRFNEDDYGEQLVISNSTLLSSNTSLNGIFLGKSGGSGLTVNITDCAYNSDYDTLGIPVYAGTASSSSVVSNVTPIDVAPTPTYTTVTLDTTLADLGVSGTTTVGLPSGTITVSESATMQEFINKILEDAKVKSAVLENGILKIVTEGGAPNLTIGFLSEHNTTQTTSEATKTVTTTETIEVEKETVSVVTTTTFITTTEETSRTVPVFTTNTVNVTGATAFGVLGVDEPMRVTVYSEGTRGYITVRSDTTLDEFYAELLTKSITATNSGGVTTLTGQGNSYIDSRNLAEMLGLSAVNNTYGTKISNTESERQYAKEKIYGVYAPGEVTLQAGVNANAESQIAIDVAFSLRGINNLRGIGEDLTTDYLTILDEMLTEITDKQTDFGAFANRLESALEEITIRRDNLVSSRSTLRDADVAQVSSKYIQQQILQQASATLLSTANQTPAIALQLI